MKKEYESPKAEKLDFDYQEAIVASSNSGNTTTGPEVGYNNDPDGQYHKCGCTPYWVNNG